MNIDKYSIKKILIIIFAVAISLRIVVSVVYFQKCGTAEFADDWCYLSYARNVLEQGIFVPDISKLPGICHLVGPAFPIIVAGTFAIFGEHYWPTFLLNSIVSSLICIFLFYFGKSLFYKKVGLLCAGWSIFYVLYIWFIPRILKEVWLALLFPLFIYLFIAESQRLKISIKSLLHILLFSFLIHMDERFITYFPFLLISLLVLDSVSWKNGLKKAVLFFSLTVVLMIPWSIRNYYVYQRLIILTERTSVITDRLFGYDMDKIVFHKMMKKWVDSEITEGQIDSILAGEKVPHLPGWKFKGLQQGLGMGLRPHKYNLYERLNAGFREYWRPFRFSGSYIDEGYRFEKPWSLRHNVSTIITYGLLLPFFIVGAFLILKNRNKIGVFIILIIIIHMLIHVVLTFVRFRYRTHIDAFIIVIAFYGLTEISSIMSRRFRKRLPAISS
ncbi:MAG: hypothetical protein KAX38_01525 [Candidatus Krumholzibacteria bacterium]|nr:hypothetical protein [Candidatus Krumholzibacteria bacterium]